MNLMINYSSKWWYKLITIILVLALIIYFSIGIAPKAKAIGVLTLTMSAAILAVLAGAGITTVVSGMSSNQIQSWLNDKLIEWDIARDDGNVFSDLIQNNLITATVKGTLAIGSATARGISDFINWLKNDISIEDNDSVVVYQEQGNFIPIKNYNGSLELPYFQLPIYGNLVDRFIPGNEYDYLVYYGSGSVVCAAYLESYKTFVLLSDTNNGNYKLGYGSNKNPGNVIFQDRTWSSHNSYFYSIAQQVNYNNTELYVPSYNSLSELFTAYENGVTSDSELILESDVINIPTIDTDEVIDIQVGAYPGSSTDEVTDIIIDGVETNTLDVDMTVTDEIVDATEVLVINEQPISVNTDHHMIGFTNLPDFAHLNLNSIWHYVSDAVDFASSWLAWFVSFLTAMPLLAIPLYMSFTLLVVLSFLRRFI